MYHGSAATFKVQRALNPLRPGITGRSEPPDIGDGDLTWVFCRSSSALSCRPLFSPTIRNFKVNPHVHVHFLRTQDS